MEEGTKKSCPKESRRDRGAVNWVLECCPYVTAHWTAGIKNEKKNRPRENHTRMRPSPVQGRGLHHHVEVACRWCSLKGSRQNDRVVKSAVLMTNVIDTVLVPLLLASVSVVSLGKTLNRNFFLLGDLWKQF